MKELLRGILAMGSFIGVAAGIAFAIIGLTGDRHHHTHHWVAVGGVALTVVCAISCLTVSWPFFRTRAWMWIVLGYSVIMAVVFVAGLIVSLIDQDWLQSLMFVGILFMVSYNNVRLSWRKLKKPRP